MGLVSEGGRRLTVRTGILLVVLAAAILLAGAGVAYAALRTPFVPPAFSTNDTGDIAIVGNTLMTCPLSAPTCADAREGNAPGANNNNNYSMEYVDVDGDASTINSSTADFTLPAGGEVLWAGLYWGGRAAAGVPREQVKFDTPDTPGYEDLTGEIVGSVPFSGGVNAYHAFANVTGLVDSGGSGTYTVGNVQATTGVDRYAGWSLVVVYRQPGAPPRNLTVFDGFADVANSTGNRTVDVGISGFQTPPRGNVNTRIGVVAYEGDRDSLNATLALKSEAPGSPSAFTPVGDELNPKNNFFNSTISRLGELINDKEPNYSNQLGFDAVVVDASGILTNDSTAATLRLATGGETYYPGVVTTAIELFAPEVDLRKQVEDVNGGEVEPGDLLEYTVTATNNGQDDAVLAVIEDAIPENAAYAPDSLRITAGANAGAKSDDADDDQAEYVSGDDFVRFRVGSGAGDTRGGTLEPGDSTTIRFRVRVDAGATGGTIVSNQAEIDYTGSTTRTDFTGSSPLAEVTVTPSPPRAVDDTASTQEDTPVEIPVLGNDGDNVDLDPSLLTVAAPPGNGTASVNADGTITYTPEDGFSGTDSFTYQICDATGLCDTATTTVTVSPVNDRPAATNDLTSTAEDEPVTVSVLSNDSDPDGDETLDPASVSITRDPDNGSVTVNADGTVRYTPNPNFSGTDTFTYRVCDTSSPPLCDTATATVRVDPVNDPPTAVNDRETTDEGKPVTVGVLSNDSDPEDRLDPSSVEIIGAPENGTVTVNSNGTVTYTPRSGFSGTDTFTYQVCDRGGACDTATATVVVEPAPEPPQADLRVRVDAPNRVTLGEKFAYTVTVSNKGPDAARATVLTSVLPKGVSFVSAPDGCTYDKKTRKVTCKLGNLEDEAVKKIKIVVRADKPGRLSLSGCGVTSDTPDPNRGDNSTSARGAAVTAVESTPSD